MSHEHGGQGHGDNDIEALKVNKIPQPAKPARDEASRVFLPTFAMPAPTNSEMDVSEAYGGKGIKSEAPIDTAAVRDAIIEVLERASTGNVPTGWARRVFWALLEAGFDALLQDNLPRHQIVDAIMTSLTEGLIAPT